MVSFTGPLMNCSSWSAKSPIQSKYGDFICFDSHFTQNFRFSVFPSLSLYTCFNRLHCVVLLPIPLFEETLPLRWSEEGFNNALLLLK